MDPWAVGIKDMGGPKGFMAESLCGKIEKRSLGCGYFLGQSPGHDPIGTDFHPPGLSQKQGEKEIPHLAADPAVQGPCLSFRHSVDQIPVLPDFSQKPGQELRRILQVIVHGHHIIAVCCNHGKATKNSLLLALVFPVKMAPDRRVSLL